MTTKQLITDLKLKLTEAIQMVNDLTDSDTQQSYTLSDGTHISYLTALVRKHVKLGWNPFRSMELKHNEIVDVTIKQGAMHFTLNNEEGKLISCYVNNITFPRII